MDQLKEYRDLIDAIDQFSVSNRLTQLSLDNKTIGQLAWALQGITHGPGFRTIPSAGATYPLEICILGINNQYHSRIFYAIHPAFSSNSFH